MFWEAILDFNIFKALVKGPTFWQIARKAALIHRLIVLLLACLQKVRVPKGIFSFANEYAIDLWLHETMYGNIDSLLFGTVEKIAYSTTMQFAYSGT